MTRLHPMPDPEGQLERLPDGPLCRHTCSVAFAAALELLASVGALRPFGVIMDSKGVVHLRVPPPASRPPRRLLESIDLLLDAETDALIRGRVDAVDLRSGPDAHHAVRVVMRRAGRETLTAYQLFTMVDGEPAPQNWWVEGVPDVEPIL
ncbi:MAG: hypothetical protein VX265_14530 [Myxococcota bacterium]|nr:hypothetical protein [Myxococcota bacterium]MEC8422253.1 hypothetical protein [Myxococcota bacterium]